MKIIFRNFYTLLSRFRMSSTLNIIGLSLAFAAFIIIIIQANFDINFDRFHSKSNRTYRLEVSQDGTQYNVLVGRKWANFIKENFPQVESIGLRTEYNDLGTYLQIDNNGQLQGFNEDVRLVHPDFIDIFDFEMVQGSQDVLTEAGNVILPQSMAQRFFGNTNAVGRQITFKGNTNTTMTVAAVYRDFPDNTLVKNTIYYGINPNVWTGIDGWHFNYELFLTVEDTKNKELLEQQILSSLNATSDIPEWIREYKYIRLTPLADIYYSTDVVFDKNPKGSASNITLLLSIAILIIIVASINFINFATALTPHRIKSINTQKVFGCSVKTLRWIMIFEAVNISLIAYIVALLIVGIAAKTSMSDFLSAQISLSQNLNVVLLSLGMALAVGFIAGIYPAFYATKFQPALALKGNFGQSSHGQALRTSLICFQYIISICLIIAALFMQLQNRYFKTFDKGYATTQVVVAKLNENINKTNRTVFLDELRKNPQIKNVAFAQFLFGNGDAQRHVFQTTDQRNVSFDFFPATEEFLDVMDIKPIEGQAFKEGDLNQNPSVVVCNDAFLKNTKVECGYTGNRIKVAGVIKNINYRPLQTMSKEPFCIAVTDNVMHLDWAYFKISGSSREAVEHIKKSIAKIDPTFPVNIKFYNEVFDNLYRNERKSTALITIFSLLTIAISLVGVFGLIIFETQYRRKEIGLRKINGASVLSLLIIFNRKFIFMICSCFVVAAAIAYYGIDKWLSGFAYRIPVYWWVFVLTLLIVLIITLLTVTLQSYKAATENPINALKSE